MDSVPVWIRRMGALAGVLAAVGAVGICSPLSPVAAARSAGRTMEPPPPKPGDDKKPKRHGMEPQARRGSNAPKIC